MTPEIQFAKSLGIGEDELAEKTAAAVASLSIDELEDLLRQDGIELSNHSGAEHVTRSQQWKTLPMPEPTLPHEKTASVDEFDQMAAIADSWGRKMAKADFQKMAVGIDDDPKTDEDRGDQWGRKGALIAMGLDSTGRLLRGKTPVDLVGTPSAALAGYGAGRFTHFVAHGPAEGKKLKKSKEKTAADSFEDIRRAVQVAVDEKLRPKKEKKSGGPCAPWPYIREVFPGFAIVEMGGQNLKFEYSIGEDGKAILKGDGTPVKQEWIEKKASVEKTALAPGAMGALGAGLRAVTNTSPGRRALVGAGVGAVGGAVAGGPNHRLSGAAGGAALGAGAGLGAKPLAEKAMGMKNSVGAAMTAAHAGAPDAAVHKMLPRYTRPIE